MRVPTSQEIWHEAMEILLAQLSPAKAMRFLAVLQTGHGDYAKIREELFGEQSMSEVAKQVRRHERQKGTA